MLDIYIDADGCPVKQETYRVAKRYALKVYLAANAWMQVPDDPSVQLKLVDDQFDAADDWIVDHVQESDIVITADIPLASRCLEKGARVLGPKGREFTEDNIGDALATREIMSQLRESGMITGGPAPFQKKDRSRFLQRLDEAIRAVQRAT